MLLLHIAPAAAAAAVLQLLRLLLLQLLRECDKTEQAIRDWAGSGPFFYKTKMNTKNVKFIKNCKTISDVPSDLLVSGRQNAIPCQLEPTKRNLMRRAPPRSSAEIQTCFVMYPWEASLPRVRKCEKKHSAAGEQREKKNEDHILYTYIG